MAGRIPQHFIDDLISRSDIVEVIQRRVPLKRAGREYHACCPFHEEKTPSFTVSPNKQFYHCFGCGEHGTALGFLMQHDHMGFVEAVEELAALAGMEVPREQGAEEPPNELYDVMREANALYRRALADNPAAQRYVSGRGLDQKTVERFNIGYAPQGWDRQLKALHKGNQHQRLQALVEAGIVIERRSDDGEIRHYDRFRERIMFPIRDARGRIIAFGGRVVGKGGERDAKYLNSPETPLFHKGRELYGLYEMRQSLRDIPRILVVEGYMDVVALAQHGIEWAVATLGTATTAEHLKKLFRITPEVVFCFDGDRAGRAAAWRALNNALPIVEGGRNLRFAFLPDGHDPDSMVREEGAEAFTHRLDDALNLSNFMISHLSEGHDMQSIEARAAVAELARPLIAKTNAGVYRELLIEQLAQVVKLPREQLDPLMPAASAGQTPPPPQRKALPQRSPGGRETLVRRAIRLILNHPAIGQTVGSVDSIASIPEKGTNLLADLIEDAAKHPNISTAGLIERWREHEYGRFLGQLAADQPLLQAEAAEQELHDVLDTMLRRASERREQQLLSQGLEALTDNEKAELQRIQAARMRRR